MNDVAGLSDLAESALTEDEGDYEVLVRALWPNAYRIAWSILGERGAAEDAAQAACAAICTKLPNLSDVRAFPVGRIGSSSRMRTITLARVLVYDEFVCISTI